MADFQICPVVAVTWSGWVGELVSLKEDALRDTSVLNTLLNDVDGVIVEVVVDGALSDSIVLGRVFDNWLLEVSFEVKNLKVSVRVSYSI